MSFQIPQDLSAMSGEELDAALEAAVKEFEPLGKLSDDEIDDEKFTRMNELAEFASAAKAKKDADAQAAVERSEKINSIRDAMAVKDEKNDEEGEEAPADEAPADEAPADEAPADEAPVDEAPADAPADEVIETITEDEAPVDIIAEELPQAEVAEDEEEKEKDAVVASGKSSIADTAKNAPKADVTESKGSAFSLIAAADVPNISAGKKFASLKDATAAISARLQAMPSGGLQTYSRNAALVIQRDTTKGFATARGVDDLEVLLAAGAESRLNGGSLVAAGGWAAPSDTLLDFCDIESNSNLIETPEVTVTRGGLNYTKGPSFEDVLKSATGFWDMNEATAEAGTELKTSLRPAVPDFNDVRLDAVGTMVEAGLLTRAGWPELVERYAKLAILAHEVKVHKKKIAQIQAFTGAAIDITNGFGNAIDILHVIDLVLAGERQRYSMGENETMEVLLPMYVRSIIRADLANRNGVDFMSITDAQIDAFFTTRKARVQFLNHYQELDLTGGVATKYPEKLEIISYPAGTYVAGVTDVIKLDTIYDSTNLKKNDYVHLFLEEGIAMTNPCNEGRRYSVALSITGRTGAADITNPLFRAVTP